MKNYISYVLKFSCDEILLKSSKYDSHTFNFEKGVNIKYRAMDELKNAECKY